MIPSHLRRHPLYMRHLIMRNSTPVAVIPIKGDTVPSRFDYWTKIGCRGSPANTVTYFEKSGLIAGHEPPLLWAIIIWVIMIRWRSRRSHVQFARVERQDRSTLTRNSDKRSVIVHATPPLRWINGTGTSGHLKETQRRSDHECKGNFHWKSFRPRL